MLKVAHTTAAVGPNALVWVSWPSTNMYVIIIILSCHVY